MMLSCSRASKRPTTAENLEGELCFRFGGSSKTDAPRGRLCVAVGGEAQSRPQLTTSFEPCVERPNGKS